jgi:hypothetical protein
LIGGVISNPALLADTARKLLAIGWLVFIWRTSLADAWAPTTVPDLMRTQSLFNNLAMTAIPHFRKSD